MGLFSSKTKVEIEKLVEENDELKNTLHSILQKNQSLTEIEKKIAEAKKELAEIAAQADEQKNELHSFNEEKNSRTEEINALGVSISQLEVKKSSLESIVLSLETNSQIAEELHQAHAAKELELKEYESRIELLKDEEERIKNLLANYGIDVETSVNKIKETEAELSEKLIQLKNEELKRNQIIKQLEEKINLSEEIKSNLENSLSGIIGQLSEKEKMFNEFSEKRDSLLEELRIKQKDYDEFENKYSFAKENIQKIEDELKALTERKSNFIEELNRFEEVKSEIQEKVLKLKSEEVFLSEQIKEKQKTIEELDKRKINLEESQIKIDSSLSQIFSRFNEETSAYKSKLNSIRHEIIEKEKELVSKEKILLEKTSQIAEYSGLAKVLQKERTNTEQFVIHLKEEHHQLSEELLLLKESISKQKLILQQLKSENTAYEAKRDLFQKEIKLLFTQTNEEFSALTENKASLIDEINSHTKELEELIIQTADMRTKLRDLKNDTAKVEMQKEEYSAKISELIAMEKNLHFKIEDYDKKPNSSS
ncbi:MAG: hypothetical protein AB1394_04925 [Bacteroidota bacterium]